MVFSKKWLRNHPKFLLHFLTKETTKGGRFQWHTAQVHIQSIFIGTMLSSTDVQ